ncbi:ABC-type sugar transport system, periplasmic component [Rhizobium leguminosarum bv. trifolii WSM597]|uniref:ABC-type sugar transport system, periplasmic component n=1 Tax=Rhizobium leguminosarum bv. trifolii WSM597 TaxID=754764 RepID=I9NMS2_RHILT|nr:substrate-binding domain-containing protein [Rhizobium leguminosarum]EJB08147.1 ABC-type sugar transport system, periplasmic component [Rhizobium leguminosarum bv. trifolii WSM597]
MRKLLITTAALFAFANAACAGERYVMVTHTQGTDPFWPIVEKAGKDAAKAIGADFEYNFAPSGDMADMAKLIESAAASQPSGMIISLPDADALGGAIKSAVASGIPVITINSGLGASKAVGALMHVGQPESAAGEAAGERAKNEGVKKALCLNQEAYNTALTDRCVGYFKALGQDLNMIDVSNDAAQIETRTAAALQANPDIDALLATGPHVCEAAAAAVDEVGAKIHLSCFDLSAGIINLIKTGKVEYTIDQQPYIQGYMPVILLHLYNNIAVLPGADLPSGPGFVDPTNVEKVAAQAGENR